MNTLLTFRLLGLPLEDLDEARQYQQSLLRELSVLDVAGRQPGRREPERLLALAAEVRTRYAPFVATPTRVLEEARRAGNPTVDVEVVLPRHVGRTAREFRDLLRRVDEMCEAGELLTTTPSERTVRFRQWYLEELEHQAAGRTPVPYPGNGGTITAKSTGGQ